MMFHTWWQLQNFTNPFCLWNLYQLKCVDFLRGSIGQWCMREIGKPKVGSKHFSSCRKHYILWYPPLPALTTRTSIGQKCLCWTLTCSRHFSSELCRDGYTSALKCFFIFYIFPEGRLTNIEHTIVLLQIYLYLILLRFPKFEISSVYLLHGNLYICGICTVILFPVHYIQWPPSWSSIFQWLVLLFKTNIALWIFFY